MKFTMHDSGRTIQVKPGEIFEIALEENPSTGYRWTNVGSVGFELVSNSFVQAGTAPGMSGHRLQSWKHRDSGMSELHLALRREWERPEQSISQFRLLVDTVP